MDSVPVTAQTLAALRPARSFAAPVNSLAFTDDSQFLLTSNDTSSLQVFDVTTGTQVCATEDFTQGVALVCPTHHHHALLYANAEGPEPTVTYFNWKLQQCIWRTTEPTHRIVQLCMSPATDAFLCISTGARLQIFDLRQRHSLYRHQIDNVYGDCAAAFDPTGTIFALGASDPWNSIIRLWDFRALQGGPYSTNVLPGGIPVTSLEFSDDGQLALMCTSDCKVTLLDAFNLAVQRTFQLDGGPGAIVKAVFSACSRFIAAGVSTKNSVELFETETGEQVHRLEGARGVRALGWNKDYLMLAVGGETLDLWLPDLQPE